MFKYIINNKLNPLATGEIFDTAAPKQKVNQQRATTALRLSELWDTHGPVARLILQGKDYVGFFEFQNKKNI